MTRLLAISLAFVVIAGCKKKKPDDVIPPIPATVDSRLTLVSVSPSRVEPEVQSTVILYGSGFARGATVAVAETQAMTVTWRSSNQLEVALPALHVGVYDVLVTNPDRAEDRLRSGLQVGVRGDAGAACDFVVLYFETDAAGLTSAAESTLGSLVPCYQSAPEPVRISGHADERGTTDYNLTLAYRRAMAVQTYLVSQGLPKARLPVTSYGEEKPAESGSSEQTWAKNRRVELALD